MKFFTKSGCKLAWSKRDAGVTILIGSGKKPTWVFVDKFVIREEEFREFLVAVGVVKGSTCEAAVDLILVVAVETVIFAATCFREAIRIAFLRFVKDDELSLLRALPWSAEVSPETGLFDIVASTIVKVSLWLGRDFRSTSCERFIRPHVPRWTRGGRCA